MFKKIYLGAFVIISISHLIAAQDEGQKKQTGQATVYDQIFDELYQKIYQLNQDTQDELLDKGVINFTQLPETIKIQLQNRKDMISEAINMLAAEEFKPENREFKSIIKTGTESLSDRLSETQVARAQAADAFNW